MDRETGGETDRQTDSKRKASFNKRANKRPQKTARQSYLEVSDLGKHCKLPQGGSGAELQPKSNFVHFSLKI